LFAGVNSKRRGRIRSRREDFGAKKKCRTKGRSKKKQEVERDSGGMFWGGVSKFQAFRLDCF
jgi:hypothetical protein